MPNNISEEDIIWDDDEIIWDQPSQPVQPKSMKDIMTGIRKEAARWTQPTGPVEGVLPATGAMLGGIGGAASPAPGGMAIGGAGGYYTGKQLESMLKGKLRTPQEQIKDINEAMLQEIGGKVIGKGAELGASRLTSLKNWLTKRNVTKEMLERIKLYEQAGVPYTPADIRQEQGLNLLESNIRRNIASATKAQEFDINKLKALRNYAADLRQSLFGKYGSLEAGEIAKSSAKIRYKEFMKKAEELYSAIPIDDRTPIDTNILRDAGIGILDDIGKVESGPLKRIADIAKRSMYEVGQVTSKYTWKQLLADQSALRKMAASTSDFNKKRMYRNLINAIDDDIVKFSETIQTPEIKEALDTAVSFYKEGDKLLPGAKVFRESKIKKDVLYTENVEDLVNKFIRPNNASDIFRLRRAVGEDAMKPIKSAWTENLFTKGENREFSPLRFSNAWDAFDDATKSAFLSKNEITGLNNLARLSREAMAVERMAGNPPGTGQTLMTFGTIKTGIRHPILTTAELIGAKKFADNYFGNSEFQKTLIFGSKTKPTSQAAIEFSNKLLRMAGMEEMITPQTGRALLKRGLSAYGMSQYPFSEKTLEENQ